MDLPIGAVVEEAMDAVARLDASRQADVDAVVGRLHDLCMTRMMHGASIPHKMQTLTALLCLAPAEGEDMVARWRGGLQHLLRLSSDVRWQDHAAALVHLACSGGRRRDAFPEGGGVDAVLEAHLEAAEGEGKPGRDTPLLSSLVRTDLILAVYNLGLFTQAYDGMVKMVGDPALTVSCAMELCRFLATTRRPAYHAAFLAAVTSMIHAPRVPWKYKYECLAKLDSRSGVRSVMNADVIPVVPCLALLETVYQTLALHALALREGDTSVVDRVTYGGMAAGAYLSVREERTARGEPGKEEEGDDAVERALLKVAQMQGIPGRQRADLADVLLSKGGVEARIQGRGILHEVGHGAAGGGRGPRWGVPGISGIRTLYEDAENVHDETLAESGEAFLETLAQEAAHGGSPLGTWKDTLTSIKALLQEAATAGKVLPASVTDAERALDRIAVDRTTATSQRLTLAEVLVLVWGKVTSPACAPHASLLKERLVEELTEMNVSDASGCTSGHFMRMVNVFTSVTEGGLRISWDSQIRGNVAGRVDASLRRGTDRVREVVAEGAMDDPTPAEQDAYVAWAASIRRALWAELVHEFVTSGHVALDVFRAAFATAFTRYLPGWLAPSRMGPFPPPPPSPDDCCLLHPPSP